MRSRSLVAVLVLLVVVAVGIFYFLSNRQADNVLRASGTIEATEVDISFQIPGRVAEVTVEEGQPVRAGETIARMAPEELTARVSQIQASLDAVNSQVAQQQATLDLRQSVVESQIRQAQSQSQASRMALERLQEGARPQEIRVAEANLAQAEAELERRQNDFQRMNTLVERGAISRQEFDASRASFRTAETAVEAARERLALTREGASREDVGEAAARLDASEAGIGIAEAGRKEVEVQRQALGAARAQVRSLEAQLQSANAQLSYAGVQSPIDGVVLTKNVESGEVVNSGTPVVTIGNITDLWMNIYIPETQTGLIKLGQTASIRVDSFPDETFTGKVTFISSESEFTPKTIQTKEERVKLVYRVKVSLENTGQRLKPGMPADAEIVLD